jgi:hypothetical protein
MVPLEDHTKELPNFCGPKAQERRHLMKSQFVTSYKRQKLLGRSEGDKLELFGSSIVRSQTSNKVGNVSLKDIDK